jgi:hemerythrin-like metal-binding protein
MTLSPEMESGDAGMDGHHRDFLAAVSAMLSCADADFSTRLQAFLAHAVEHFGSEDRMMEGQGYATKQCHLDEHKAVLASGDEVKTRVAAGDIEVGRRYARELLRWFPEHTREMDLGLAAWVQKQRLGGARIKIQRRGVGASG